MKLLRHHVLAGVAAAIALVGCTSDPTAVCQRRDAVTGICLDRGTPTPPPSLCPFSLNCSPIAGFPEIYSCAPDVAGPYTIRVNETSQAVEYGQLVFASSGDRVQGCRSCGCSEAYRLR